jgi:NCS2 family nucleobase:cation symporter-2
MAANRLKWLDLGFLSRQKDHAMVRPPGLVYWHDDIPPHAMTLGLALQHLAIQSIYFVIPTVIAGSLSNDPGDATRFLCLSILAAALWQVLQLLARGPVGSGYPIPGTHTAALVGAYALTGAMGGGFGAAGAMLMLAGALCVLLTFGMHRLRVALPNEVAGVVVILIGVALVVLGTHRLGLNTGETPPDRATVLALGSSLAVMVAVALSRSRAAPFAVLIGALFGVPLSLYLGEQVPNAGQLLAAQPWLALPQPWAPQFEQVTFAPLSAFLIALVALKATTMGSLVMVQRNSDAAWSKPDAGPIRRGLLANAMGMLAAGLLGAASPGPATAAVGLSVATGTLARRIVWLGAGLLGCVSFCPKLVALFVLMPEPIKAAMLFYVAGFIMAQGCQLVTARLLDTRRSLIVAFGLSAGIVVAVAPHAIAQALPALASPLSVGAMVAFLMNLITLPLVARQSSTLVAVSPFAGRHASDWFAGVAGSWALKPGTANTIEHALAEFMDLLVEMHTAAVTITANLAEDRVELSLRWSGDELPAPPRFASAEDLMGSDASRHAFSMWLACRHSHGFRKSRTGSDNEIWLAFED